jgi:hypothetical protein
VKITLFKQNGERQAIECESVEFSWGRRDTIEVAPTANGLEIYAPSVEDKAALILEPRRKNNVFVRRI